MTFKFLDWVSELGKWLDWLAMYPQRGCRKREASFRDYVNYLHLWSCYNWNDFGTSSRRLPAGCWRERYECLSAHIHMPIHIHGQIVSQTLYHVSSQSLTEKTLLQDLNASHIEDH